MQSAKAPTISAFGAQIPVVGYGTMRFPEPERAVDLIVRSLECGYRHIDTARKYGSAKASAPRACRVRIFGSPPR